MRNYSASGGGESVNFGFWGSRRRSEVLGFEKLEVLTRLLNS